MVFIQVSEYSYPYDHWSIFCLLQLPEHTVEVFPHSLNIYTPQLLKDYNAPRDMHIAYRIRVFVMIMFNGFSEMHVRNLLV